MYSKKLSSYITPLFLTVFVLFCLLVPGSTISAAASDASMAGWGYFMYLYDNSNGLSTSEANAVAQTSIGFIWIGGYSGLTRYDGNEFKHFDPTTDISNVNCLYVDSKDRLWVGTNDSGLAVRQNAQFNFWGRN